MKKIISLSLVVLLLLTMVPNTMAAWICPACGGTSQVYDGNAPMLHNCENGEHGALCADCWNCDNCMVTKVMRTNYTNGTQVIYTANNSESWTVTVPAQLAPGSSGDVVAQGTWGSDRKLVVTADETVTLANSINANDTKTLDIGFAGIELAGSNTAAVSATEAVGVADIENALFGTWSGTFYYDVEMKDVAGTETPTPEQPAELITFSLSGNFCSCVDGTYQAEEGMTWREWIESDYNQISLSIDEESGIWCTCAENFILDTSYLDTAIVAGEEIVYG